MRTGVFVGSFDPFTIGHEAIVNRALGLFDHLVIGVVGDNVHKQGMRPAEERMQCIADLYADNPAVEVKPYYGLAVEFANRHLIIICRTRIPEHQFQYGARIGTFRSRHL